MQLKADTLQDIPKICETLIPTILENKVVLINGKMGSGKTTLIAELCRQMNCTTEASSPTYSIVNEYETHAGEVIYHFDLYRLKSIDEALDIGFEQYLDSGNICLIEWPDIALAVIYPPAMKLNISNENGSRHYEIELL